MARYPKGSRDNVLVRQLREEIADLRQALQQIKDCQDERCGPLCQRCCQAIGAR